MEQTMKKFNAYLHCCLTTGMGFAQHAMCNTLKMDKVVIKVNEAILLFYLVVRFSVSNSGCLTVLYSSIQTTFIKL